MDVETVVIASGSEDSNSHVDSEGVDFIDERAWEIVEINLEPVSEQKSQGD